MFTSGSLPEAKYSFWISTTITARLLIRLFLIWSYVSDVLWSERKNLTIRRDQNLMGNSLVLYELCQLLAAQRHMVHRIHVYGDDGRVRQSAVHPPGIFFAHDDRVALKAC